MHAPRWDQYSLALSAGPGRMHYTAATTRKPLMKYRMSETTRSRLSAWSRRSKGPSVKGDSRFHGAIASPSANGLSHRRGSRVTDDFAPPSYVRQSGAIAAVRIRSPLNLDFLAGLILAAGHVRRVWRLVCGPTSPTMTARCFWLCRPLELSH